MKKILILIGFLYSINSFSQSTVLLRGDTIKVYKQGGDAVLKVEGHLMLKDYRQGNSNDSVLTWDATTKKVRMMDRAGFGGSTPTLTQYYVGVGDAGNLLSGSANLQFQSGALAVNNSGGNDGIIQFGYGIMKEFVSVSTPASGYGTIYTKNDGTIHYKNSAGTDYDLTSGGGGSGTVNTGSALKAAYYPSAGTTVDDVTGVEYNNTGLLAKFSAQATTDTALHIRLQSSATAPPFIISSAGTVGGIMSVSPSGKTLINTTNDTDPILTTSSKFKAVDGLMQLSFVENGSGQGWLAVSNGTITGFIGHTNPTDGFTIGSFTGHDFTIRQSNVARFKIINSDATTRIDQKLYVGGLATAPTETLHVGGNGKFTGFINMAEQSAPSTPASATAVIYPKSDGLWYGKDDAGLESRLSNLIKSKGVTLESPTSAEDFGMWKTQVDITVSSINAVVKGSSPSVTINIAFGSNITSLTNVFSSGTAITNTTTGQTINSGFNDATIPAGSWIRLISTASSGTISQIEVTINYTED
jgi:hypothetical protein